MRILGVGRFLLQFLLRLWMVFWLLGFVTVPTLHLVSKFSVHTPDNVYVLQEEWLKRPDIVFDDQTSVFVGNNVGMLVMVSSFAFKNSYTGMYRESMEGDARTHTKGNYYRAVFSTVRHISAFFFGNIRIINSRYLFFWLPRISCLCFVHCP